MKPYAYRLQILPETDSTNRVAKEAAEAGEADGLVVHALTQTAGRGRQGRVWESPRGNLYLSVLLRTGLTQAAFGLTAFMTALAVADTVTFFLPSAEVTVKWPNDVLVQGRKISGILIESGSDSLGQNPWLVIGTGVNMATHPTVALYPTTSLSAEGATGATVEAVRDLYLEKLAFWRERLVNEGFEPLRAAWLQRAQKGDMQVRLPHETVEGRFGGLDPQGCLILVLADGSERRIASGDVFFN